MSAGALPQTLLWSLQRSPAYRWLRGRGDGGEGREGPAEGNKELGGMAEERAREEKGNRGEEGGE